VSSSDHLLVLSRPSVPGGWCGELYIRAYLDEDAWQGMTITNTAEIYASNDLDPNNDRTTWWGNVGGPHTNLSVWKNWYFGTFVPGGQINYEFQYRNNGNLPAENVLVTNTLPAGTSFLFAYTWGDWGWIPITPTVVTPEYLVWDVGLLEVPGKIWVSLYGSTQRRNQGIYLPTRLRFPRNRWRTSTTITASPGSSG
jgi:uncharacterized repeat protein (TIGR01451 family)